MVQNKETRMSREREIKAKLSRARDAKGKSDQEKVESSEKGF